MHKILIVGAGPTGLVLSLALLQKNIPVKLIDKKNHPSVHSKALAIHPRTLEVLAKLGVASSLIDKGRKAHSVIFHLGNKEQRFELEHLEDTPYPFVLMLPQSETENILIEAIKKFGGNVQWGSELIGIEENEAILSNGEKIPFDWIIACDGGSSSVRHCLKLPFNGYELQETFLIIDVEGKSKAHDSSPHVFFSKKGLAGIIAFQSNLNRLIFPMSENQKIAEDLFSIQEELSKRGCADFIIPTQVKWFSYFKIHRRMVNRMMVANCFFAGDAAHIHSPAGGQGMNTCIQDAFNLAWKLGLVVKGNAKKQLLDSYELERLPIARKVLSGTTRFTQLLNFVQKTGCFFIVFFGLFLMNHVFKRRFTRILTELSYTYKKSQFIKEPWQDMFWRGPKCGQRAPNVKLENGKDLFEYFDRLNPILLLFEENASLKDLGCDLVILQDANLKKAYKANKNSIYFIRPDGVIGYRSRYLKNEEVKKYLSSIFLNIL